MVLIAIIVLTLLPLCIKLDYRRENNNDSLGAAVSLLGGALPVRFNIPVARLRKRKIEMETELGQPQAPFLEKRLRLPVKMTGNLLQQLIQSWAVIKYLGRFFFKHTCWRQFEIEARFATAEAALTGLLYGGLTCLSANLERLAGKRMKFKHGSSPRIKIFPTFDSQETWVSAKVQFTIRAAYFIYLAARLILIMLKGGSKSGRAPDSGSDGNSDGKPEGNGGC